MCCSSFSNFSLHKTRWCFIMWTELSNKNGRLFLLWDITVLKLSLDISMNNIHMYVIFKLFIKQTISLHITKFPCFMKEVSNVDCQLRYVDILVSLWRTCHWLRRETSNYALGFSKSKSLMRSFSSYWVTLCGFCRPFIVHKLANLWHWKMRMHCLYSYSKNNCHHSNRGS